MFEFIKEFIKSPKSIGSIAPSSRYLSNKMIEDINFEICNCIVEYGPGTGVFTEKIIARKKEDTLFLVFENDRLFANKLINMYGHKKNVKIINDSAENIKRYLDIYNISNVDYIISGLPFTSLPKEVSNTILKNTSSLLHTNGEFITFQYSLIKKDYFKNYFKNIYIDRVIANIPPAYVLKCTCIDKV